MSMQSQQILLTITVTTLVVSAFFLFYIAKKGNDQCISSDSSAIFEKQRQCVLLREGAKKKMEDDFKIATPFFYDIFYSPVTDSCLYTYGLLLAGEAPNEIGSFNLVDYFSGKTIISEQYDNSSDDFSKNSPDVREKWNMEVSKYATN